MKVLVLGHKGMLGHMVHWYLTSKWTNHDVITTDLRWPTDEFKKKILDFDGDYVVNCIGAIHQRADNFDVNSELPIWLDDNLTNCRVIHPGTDCEMDDDDYGNSKRKATEYLIEKGNVTKIIKTSIIGPELNTKSSLMEWFLDSEGEISGYTKAYWNGNTTLWWAKICDSMMLNWDEYETLNVPVTQCISKYELLNTIKDVYGKDIQINKNSDVEMNKCLEKTFDIVTHHIKTQLIYMRNIYGN